MKRIALSLMIVLSLSTLAFAGAQTGNISTDVKTGDNTNVGMGMAVEAKQSVGGVEVKDGAKTGNISTSAKTGDNTNVGMGMGVKADQNAGGVKVGN